MPQLGPGAAVSEVTLQIGGVDVSHGCPLLGLNGRMTGRGRTERPNDRPRPVAAGRPAAAGRLPDEGAATAAGAAAAAVARPQLLLETAAWRRSGRTTAERGRSYSRTTAGRLARLWASSTFPKFSHSRGQPWLTSTPLVCLVTSETTAPGPSRGTVQVGGERNGGANLDSF